MTDRARCPDEFVKKQEASDPDSRGSSVQAFKIPTSLLDHARTGILDQTVEPLLLGRHAEEFLYFALRNQSESLFLAHPRLRIRLRGIDGHIDFERIAIHSAVT